MRGKAYLDLAQEILAGNSEVHHRGALGRAYYALMLECRESLFRWGFHLPPRENVHTFVRMRFNFPADPNLKAIGFVVEKLGQIRNWADYDLSQRMIFSTPSRTQKEIADVEKSIALLETIENDATHAPPPSQPFARLSHEHFLSHS